MHFKKRAEIKANLLNEEGKDAIPKRPDDEQAVEESVDAKLDKKMGGMNKYDARKKFRKASFGDEKPSRVVESGFLGILDNNEVNFLMALTMSLGAMAIASWCWEVPFESILSL